jgi:hypothetical protein
MSFGGAEPARFGDPDPEDDRLHISDLAKLLRRTRRGIVGAARAGDRPTFTAMLAAHLGTASDDLEIVEESWPGYDHVNVQVALDAWLAGPRRTHQIVGIANFRHEQFGLPDLLRPSMFHGPMPGSVSWASPASGPDGQVQRAVRAGVYLVTDGDTRAVILLLGADPGSGTGSTRMHVVVDPPAE